MNTIPITNHCSCTVNSATFIGLAYNTSVRTTEDRGSRVMTIKSMPSLEIKEPEK